MPGLNSRFNKKISQQIAEIPLESARNSFVSSSPTFTQASVMNDNYCDFGISRNNQKGSPQLNFSRKLGDKDSRFQITDEQKNEIRKTLNQMGFMYMLGFWLFLLLIRN